MGSSSRPRLWDSRVGLARRCGREELIGPQPRCEDCWQGEKIPRGLGAGCWEASATLRELGVGEWVPGGKSSRGRQGAREPERREAWPGQDPLGGAKRERTQEPGEALAGLDQRRGNGGRGGPGSYKFRRKLPQVCGALGGFYYFLSLGQGPGTH